MMEPAVQSGLTETVLQSVWSVLKPVPSHRSPALLRAHARNKGTGAASYLCQATEDREVWGLPKATAGDSHWAVRHGWASGRRRSRDREGWALRADFFLFSLRMAE